MPGGTRPTHGFGIIGCGMIARFHAQAIQQISGARLVGCCSHSLASAEKFAAEFPCRVYPGLAELLADPEIDVVCICTPSGAHLEPALAATAAGRHVVVEKPLEITLERCDALLAAAAANQVKVCAIFPSRFSPANQALKAAITAGRFGRLTLGDTYVKWWRTQQYYDSGGWRGTWSLDGGGACMNQAIHNVDLLWWMMGDVAAVSGFTATLAHERIEVEDVAVAALKFTSGALGVIEASTSVFPGLLKRIEIHGTQGTAIIEQDDMLRWEFADEQPADAELRQRFARASTTTGGAADPKAISFRGHQLQLEDFLESIDTGREPAVTGAEGRKSVEIILALYAASQTGQTIQLPLASSPTAPRS